MMEHLFEMRPDTHGYRLHWLEIFNWGTFDSSDGILRVRNGPETIGDNCSTWCRLRRRECKTRTKTTQADVGSGCNAIQLFPVTAPRTRPVSALLLFGVMSADKAPAVPPRQSSAACSVSRANRRRSLSRISTMPVDRRALLSLPNPQRFFA